MPPSIHKSAEINLKIIQNLKESEQTRDECTWAFTQTKIQVMINVARTIDFTTFPNITLLKPLVLQHFQKQCCQNHWGYNISNTDAAKTNSFTTHPKIVLSEPLLLQHFQQQCCQNHWFYNISKNNVAKIIVFSNMSKTNAIKDIGFSTFPKIMLLNTTVLQSFQKQCY